MSKFIYQGEVSCDSCGYAAQEGDTFHAIGGCIYCEENGCAEEARDAVIDHQAFLDNLKWDDPQGDLDPTPEQQAGRVFEDKLAMYRNEY